MIQTVNAYPLNTLTNAFPVCTLKCKSLNTIAPKVHVVILVLLYEEEVPSAHHDRQTSAITMRGVRLKSPTRFLLRDLAV